MKKLRLLVLALVSTLAVCLTPAGAVAQDILDPACQTDPNSALCDQNNKNQGLDSNSVFGPTGLITRIVSLLSIVVGVAAVLMIIVGGVRYVLSSGDSQNIEGAKNAILYAVIGLVVSIFAQGIVIFVLNKL